MASERDGSDGRANKALAQAGITATAVIARMKEATGSKTDAQLAEYLQTSAPNISKWKKRNHIPFAEAVFVALKSNVHISQIISGQPITRIREAETNVLNVNILRAVLGALWRLSAFKLPSQQDETLQIDFLAKAIATRYYQAQVLAERLITEQGLKGESAEQAVVSALEMLFSNSHFFDDIKRRL